MEVVRRCAATESTKSANSQPLRLLQTQSLDNYDADCCHHSAEARHRELIASRAMMQSPTISSSSTISMACVNCVQASSSTIHTTSEHPRFKIVKIDRRINNEGKVRDELTGKISYKRGRWSVVDYYDVVPSPAPTVEGHNCPGATSPQGTEAPAVLHSAHHAINCAPATGHAHSPHVLEHSASVPCAVDTTWTEPHVEGAYQPHLGDVCPMRVRSPLPPVDVGSEPGTPSRVPFKNHPPLSPQGIGSPQRTFERHADSPGPLEAHEPMESSTKEGGSNEKEATSTTQGTPGHPTVALDNKIEQAMDLVKSHLMFAVREEVDDLKERIAELLDRIQFLEVENTTLRNHVPQDVLATLALPANNLANPVPVPQAVVTPMMVATTPLPPEIGPNSVVNPVESSAMVTDQSSAL